MDEDILNLQVRQFLKKVGINSQRHIEAAVREANARGELSGGAVKAVMRLEIDGLDLAIEIDGDIAYE